MGTAGEGADSTGNPGDANGAGWKPGKEESSAGVASTAGCSEAGVPSPAMEAGDPKARPGWGEAGAGDGATDGAAAQGLWATKPAACRGTEVNSATPAEYRSKTCIERCTGMCTWKFFQSTQQMRRPTPMTPLTHWVQCKYLWITGWTGRQAHSSPSALASAILTCIGLSCRNSGRSASGLGRFGGRRFRLGIRA